MGLETGTYISDLNPSNPVDATDLVNEGDDHLRLVKSTILNTFPNITGAMTKTHTELNAAAIKTDAASVFEGTVKATGFLGPSLYNDEAPGTVELGFEALPVLTTRDGGILVQPSSVSNPSIILADAGAVERAQLNATPTLVTLRSELAGSNIRLQAGDGAGGYHSVVNGVYDGVTNLYWAGQQVLETANFGIKVTATPGTNAFIRLQDDSGSQLRLQKVSAGAAYFRNIDPGQNVFIEGRDGADSAIVPLVYADPDGAVDLYHAGTKKVTTTDGGLLVQGKAVDGYDILRLGTERAWSFRSELTGSATQMHLVSEGGNKIFEIRTGTNIPGARFTPAGVQQLMDPSGDLAFQSATATERAAQNSSAFVYSQGSSARPIGYNTLPTTNFAASGPLTNASNGERLDSTAVVSLTINTDSLAVEGCVVLTARAGQINIVQGTGTLVWFTGTDLLVGSRTLSVGGVATINRRSDGTYDLWGSGIS